jgi:hypothetical protein
LESQGNDMGNAKGRIEMNISQKENIREKI